MNFTVFNFFKIRITKRFLSALVFIWIIAHTPCMKILLASNNQHKKEELAAILHPHKILLANDANYNFDFEETGQTFFENAYGKAEALFRLSGQPVLADDSGLCVEALGAAPGIYSARFGSKEKGRMLSTEERNAYLLEKMRDKKERSAFFVCCMVLITAPYRFFTAQEILPGQITREAAGSGGFGYDPLFFLPEYGCTLAEISAQEKNAISHRARASLTLRKLLADS